MGDFRFVNGVARGPYANFFTRTDNLLPQADTTPDVTLGNLFWTNNSGSTVITDFELTDVSGPNVAQKFEGKEIEVHFLDSNTQIASNSRIILGGTDGLFSANDAVRFVYHNSAWYETGRSTNRSEFVSVNSTTLAATGMVDVLNRSFINAFPAASSALTLRGATNGHQGQRLSIYNANSSLILVVNSAAANTFVLTSSSTSTSFVMAASTLVTFYLVGGQWIEAREGNTAAAI